MTTALENRTEGNSEIDLAERMALRKRNAALRVGTHADIIGISLSKITPLMTQAVSAMTVGYATYEGIKEVLGAPWWLALAAGAVAAIAVEGVGYVAVDERDRAEAHNRRTKDVSQHIDTSKANAYVYGSFVITMAIVATFESVPAIVRYAEGTAELGEMLFRCGLLVFPWLARLGANLLAFRSVREQVDAGETDAEIRSLKVSLQKDELVARHRAKVAKIKGSTVAQPSVSVPNSSGSDDEKQLPETDSETIEKQIVLFLVDNPEAMIDDIASHIGVTKGTISKKASTLVERHILSERREGRRRLLSANGLHEQFLNG